MPESNQEYEFRSFPIIEFVLFFGMTVLTVILSIFTHQLWILLPLLPFNYLLTIYNTAVITITDNQISLLVFEPLPRRVKVDIENIIKIVSIFENIPHGDVTVGGYTNVFSNKYEMKFRASNEIQSVTFCITNKKKEMEFAQHLRSYF
jgi:hypothetical protein